MNYDLTIEVIIGLKCVGAFKVKMYDRFGEMEVSKWGKEIRCSNTSEKSNFEEEFTL